MDKRAVEETLEWKIKEMAKNKRHTNWPGTEAP